MKKPPLGLCPREIWEDKRTQEISEAIKRYIDTGFIVPLEWIKEYNELRRNQLERMYSGWNKNTGSNYQKDEKR